MPNATHAPGLPAWVEVSADDINKQVGFYTELFGLTGENLMDDKMPYFMLSRDGNHAAGVMPKMSPEQPVQWLLYFQTADIKQTIAKIEAAGGTVWIPPSEIPGPEPSYFSVASDPAGAPFGLLETKNSTFSLFGEPGFPAWFELQLPGGLEAEAEFYTKVFGWQIDVMADTPEMHYLTWGLTKEQPFGGIFDMMDYVPAGTPAHWAIIFTVPDADAAVAKVVELGGKVLRPVMPSPYGPMATVADAEGAVFIVLKPEYPTA